MSRPLTLGIRLIVMLWLMSMAGVLHAAQWTATPGEPLQPLIARASDGDRLVLPAGRYPGQVTIDRRLHVQGEPGAILDAGGQGHAVLVSASDCVLEGLRIEHWGHDLTALDAAIFVKREAHGCEIRDNHLQGPGFGVWLDGTRDVRVIGNRIRGDRERRSQDRGNGIHLFNVSHSVIEANDVAQTRDGIYLDSSRHNVLRDNHLHDLRYGVHYMYSFDNRLEDNVTRGTRTGYALMQSKRLEVVGNHSIYDDNYGILMNNITDSRLEGNRIVGVTQPLGADGEGRISGGDGKAIFVYNSQFNRFEDNRFEASDIGIHLTAGSEDNVMAGNAFIANRQQVMYVATREQDWSGNYWSDYLGWDLSDDGIGDTPHEPNDAMDRLLWRYPVARLLMDSPAVLALRWVQREFPVFRPPGVKDSAPLMHDPAVEGLAP
ncbi:nitrous oxide reductase family maturation protein NosD [Litchfieldella xinjiangensis]|uniref:nitrous oxide reductase family maturation protein NosD n=1 Tax=Litchfieldella xinjiangensis TaxID=1166948 RepID=UPI0009DEB64E|nr:nitrous oxide reductase family maturation protein NosD [Halomonas xinjiangensis]